MMNDFEWRKHHLEYLNPIIDAFAPQFGALSNACQPTTRQMEVPQQLLPLMQSVNSLTIAAMTVLHFQTLAAMTGLMRVTMTNMEDGEYWQQMQDNVHTEERPTLHRDFVRAYIKKIFNGVDDERMREGLLNMAINGAAHLYDGHKRRHHEIETTDPQFDSNKPGETSALSHLAAIGDYYSLKPEEAATIFYAVKPFGNQVAAIIHPYEAGKTFQYA